MDLRARVPSTFLLGKAIGNFFFLPTVKENTEKEIDIQEMVFKLRNTKKELDELIKEDSDQVGERLMSAMLSTLYEMSPETETYVVTSWCRIPFYRAISVLELRFGSRLILLTRRRLCWWMQITVKERKGGLRYLKMT